jgi:hypothetical protein
MFRICYLTMVWCGPPHHGATYQYGIAIMCIHINGYIYRYGIEFLDIRDGLNPNAITQNIENIEYTVIILINELY